MKPVKFQKYLRTQYGMDSSAIVKRIEDFFHG